MLRWVLSHCRARLFRRRPASTGVEVDPLLFRSVTFKGCRVTHPVRAYQTDDGSWVVADDGGWIPGTYDSEAAALEWAREFIQANT